MHEAGRGVIEVFFDGACPLCKREIDVLRRLDRRAIIGFTDIAAPSFDAASFGRTQAELMGSIHARAADGEWVTGVEVFRRMYEAIGLGGLVAVTRLRPVDAVLRRAYEVFARNRLRWTGRRCEEGTCATG